MTCTVRRLTRPEEATALQLDLSNLVFEATKAVDLLNVLRREQINPGLYKQVISSINSLVKAIERAGGPVDAR